MTRPTRLLLATIGAALSLGAASCSGGSNAGTGSSSERQATPAALHGAVPDQKDPKPSFTLTDTGGVPFDLSARTSGKVTLLYFGYTHCPDECPTSMADVAQALRQVGPSVARHVAVVFVTTDPWRDTRAVLRRWLDRFSASFVGLTGTHTQLAGVEVQMGMPISRREPPVKGQPKSRYSVAHFAAVWAYGRDGRLVTLYPSGVTPADIAADLRVLVKG